MLRHKSLYLIPAVLLLVALGVFLGMTLDGDPVPDDTFDQLRKLEDAFVIINRQYVEAVDAEALTEEAIERMLQHLDPHSTYISAREAKEVQEGYEGSFGGIGIWFEVPRNDDDVSDDTVRVVSVISDGPSEKVGLAAGDRIVAINDSTAVGMDDNAVKRRLKGPIGTTVGLKVRRRGVREPLAFTITRGRIPLYTVDASYMIDERTGYLRISRFAMTTYDEFLDHMERLRADGMERLVLDLRANPGGIMEAAVEILDEMLGAGQAIVVTRGRNPQTNASYDATAGGSWEHQPVIVLVNEYSASASEIVAGALQDHDRALIVGQRTFGKGLVQNQFPLPDGSFLQMTVARYYTPSGRLIQTPYDDGDQATYYERKFATLEDATFDPAHYKESIPDSLHFRTAHGRLVFGGGGILPDAIVRPDTTALVNAVLGSGLDIRFVREWFRAEEGPLRDRWTDEQEAFVRSFTLPEARWNAFWKYASENGLKLTDRAADADPSEGIFARTEAAKHRRTLETFIKARLAQELFGNQAWYPIYQHVDPELREGLKLWSRAEALAAYHARRN